MVHACTHTHTHIHTQSVAAGQLTFVVEVSGQGTPTYVTIEMWTTLMLSMLFVAEELP